MMARAEGREVIETPDHLAGKGPCPHCQHEIWPSSYTFKVGPEDAKAGGIVVCANCCQPLMFFKPGEYKAVPRKTLRQLPRITQRFIKSEQEMFTRLKRMVN